MKHFRGRLWRETNQPCCVTGNHFTSGCITYEHLVVFLHKHFQQSCWIPIVFVAIIIIIILLSYEYMGSKNIKCYRHWTWYTYSWLIWALLQMLLPILACGGHYNWHIFTLSLISPEPYGINTSILWFLGSSRIQRARPRPFPPQKFFVLFFFKLKVTQKWSSPRPFIRFSCNLVNIIYTTSR